MSDPRLHHATRALLVGLLTSALITALSAALLCQGSCMPSTGQAYLARTVTLGAVLLAAALVTRRAPPFQLRSLLRTENPQGDQWFTQLVRSAFTAACIFLGFGLTRFLSALLSIPLLTEAGMDSGHITQVLPFLFGEYFLILLLAAAIEPRLDVQDAH